jgi:hypothetical protein
MSGAAGVSPSGPLKLCSTAKEAAGARLGKSRKSVATGSTRRTDLMRM